MMSHAVTAVLRMSLQATEQLQITQIDRSPTRPTLHIAKPGHEAVGGCIRAGPESAKRPLPLASAGICCDFFSFGEHKIKMGGAQWEKKNEKESARWTDDAGRR